MAPWLAVSVVLWAATAAGSGDVRVTVRGDDTLVLRGDAADTAVRIVAEDDEVTVIGLDGTTIDGESSRSFEDIDERIRADLGKGDDTLEIEGAGDDLDLLLRTGPGKDQVSVAVEDLEDVRITTGAGNDEIEILAGDSDDVRITTGPGEDRVVLSLEVDDLRVTTGAGDDVVELSLGGSDDDGVSVVTGGGDDTVTVSDSELDGRFRVITGGGVDSASFTNIDVDDAFRVSTGGGDDQVEVRDSSFEDALIDCGGGSDELTESGNDAERFRVRRCDP